MGYYTKFIDRSGEYRFTLHASNGEPILASEGYASSAGRDNGIKSVQMNSQIDSRYENRTSINGEPYFVLKAGNGEIIGTSEMYRSTQARETGKVSVKANGSTTDIRER